MSTKKSLAKAAEAFAPQAVQLVYVSDEMPGLRRERKGDGFAYRDARGRAVRNAAEITRIRSLAIPPAYEAVWICPLPNGHLQATGRDARGRKQYRYHPQWSEERGAGKFERLEAFGRALPAIRRKVARDLGAEAGATPSRTLVLATLVRLLDTTYLRIGNEAYARENGSYGLTTLRNPHAGVKGDLLKLRFRGKSGVVQEVQLRDPKVARVVRRCQQLPGQELFNYVDGDGNICSLGSGDVNDYLASAAGERFTAKDFRTWHASVLALELVRRSIEAGSAGASLRDILGEVAKVLGNTPAVCRKSYVHPGVLAMLAGKDGAAPPPRSSARGLKASEVQLLGFLRRRRLAQKAPARRSLRHAL